MSGDRVLIIGGGGREHAIAWKLAQSSHVAKIYVAPGNSGTSLTPKTTNIDLDLKSHQKIASWCFENKIHLVCIGPEDSLADGIVDHLENVGIICFGPVQQAAQIEASKEFAKNFMQRHGIPTAQFKSFTKPSEAKDHIRNASYPALVVKASGLAAGKGVVVAGDVDEACQAVDELAKLPAGAKLVVEELLEGEEVSVLAFCDGVRSVTMLPAQDHKQLLDGDQGPNTGGMGAYCPSNLLSEEELDYVCQNIIQPVIDGLRKEGITYRGVLYAGLMKTDKGIKVLEFNCRFGDPEAQVILPLLQSDLYEIMKACAQESLPENLKWSGKVSVGIVMCSTGYPGPCEKGIPIEGADPKTVEDLKTFDIGKSKQFLCDFDIIFHAGMSCKDMKLVTNGGRVLCAVSVASSITEAAGRAKSKVSRVSFSGAHFRKDIGHRQIMRNLLNEGRLTYSKAGVSIDTASDFIRIIRKDVERTQRLGSMGTIGGFGGVFDLRASGYTDPLLVSGTDGVGTKLKIAQAVGNHGTIGIDLVAMCVNDVLAEGAEPLFFLDYFACGQLDVNVASQIVSGVAEGCLQAACALTGGETAEMPGVYSPGDYDLAGFAVGAVSRNNLLPKKDQMTDGDTLIGLASSGVHSNGLSLARKVVERSGLDYSSKAPFAVNQTIGEVLLTPTKIYVKSVLPILKTNRIKGVAHITGGGLNENITRALPKNLVAELDATRWEIPAVFGWLAVVGQINEREMLRTFNCGLGLVLIVSSKDVDSVLSDLPAGSQASVVGHLRKRRNEDDPEVTIHHFDTAIKPVMRPFIHSLVDRETYRKKVAVLISGGGTNLQALIDRTTDATIKNSARIVLVVSNVPSASGLDRALRAGIETQVIDHKLYSKRLDFDMAMHELLQKYDIDLVCLAGFMRILTPEFTSLWRGRLINIHPALLPSFKGVHAQRQALEAGVRLSGCTVHFAEADVDAGAIIYQEAVPVLPDDNEGTLTERIKHAEHKIFPEALEAVASGRIKLNEQGKIQHC